MAIFSLEYTNSLLMEAENKLIFKGITITGKDNDLSDKNIPNYLKILKKNWNKIIDFITNEINDYIEDEVYNGYTTHREKFKTKKDIKSTLELKKIRYCGKGTFEIAIESNPILDEHTAFTEVQIKLDETLNIENTTFEG